MASSVERLDRYANWKGSREGGGDRLDVVHDKSFKALYEDRSK